MIRSELVGEAGRPCVARIRFDRIDKKNAITAEMYPMLGAALAAADADPQVRARRRTLEALARGEAADEVLVLADILKRDERDKNRAAAPLKAAADAHILDNSNLDIEGGVRAAIAIVEAVRAGR